MTTSDHPTPTRRAAGLALGAAVVAMGLAAGLFYAFACAVMPGLDRTGDRVLIEAMQEIDEAIVNPAFLLSFLGAPLLGLAAAILEWRSGARRAAAWIAAAVVLYLVGCLLVTAAVNVPLNDDLADAGDPARIADPAAVRDDFVDEWVAWNIVRAIVATVALACLCRALALRGRGRGRASEPGGR